MKIINSLIFFVFLSSVLSAQPELKWFNPTPDGIALNSIWFVDSGHAWAVGEKGKILFWNGHNWSRQESNTDRSLKSVYFTDAWHGWAVGSNGCILKFENNQWTDHSLNDNVNLSCVVLPGPDEGWICGDTILRLSNNVWTVIPEQDTLYFSSMSFTSPSDGWAISQGIYLYHFDGINWTCNLKSYTDGPMCNLSFSDKDHGIIAKLGFENGLLLNYDHGNLTIPSYANYIKSVFMIDSLTGYAVGNGAWWSIGDSRSRIYKYDNSSWIIDTIVETPLYSIQGNADLVWATGAAGNIYLKQNGKWKLINSYTDQSIAFTSFPDSLHGWMASKSGYIFKYRDGIFETDTVFPDLKIYNLHFTDSLTGFAIADKVKYDTAFQFLEYRNNKWSATDVHSKNAPISFSAVDRSHIWAICLQSILFYNGTTWEVEYSGLQGSHYFEGIHFVDSETGFAIGTNTYLNSFLLKFSSNNWTVLNDNLPAYMIRIGASDDQYCWMTSYYGHIWKYNSYTNALIEEIPQQNSAFEKPLIQMISGNKGYISNLNGLLEYDGTSWSPINELSDITPLSFDFTHESFKWVGGYYGILLSTYAKSPLEIPANPKAEDFSIRVYPNPVTENTVIEYFIERSASVKVEITDAYGRLLFSDDLGDRKAGLNTYRLTKPFTTPGIYICRIKIGNEVKVVKLAKY